MTTGMQLDELQLLRAFLQQRLQLALPHRVPFSVQCVIKSDQMVILAQHPPGSVPSPQQIFSVLKQAILHQESDFPHQVKLYLRVIGQTRPYAFDSFIVKSYPHNQKDGLPDVLLRGSKPDHSSLIVHGNEQSAINHEQGGGDGSLLETWDGRLSEEPVIQALASPHPQGEVTPPSHSGDEIGKNSGSLPTSVDGDGLEKIDLRKSFPDRYASSTTDDLDSTTNPWDQLIPEPDGVPQNSLVQESLGAESTESSSTPDLEKKPQDSKRFELGHVPPSLLVAGAGMAAFFFCCTLYILTRPCVIGASCMQVAEAQNLSKESEQTFQQPSSGKEILEAQKQLKSAINMLETIPYWSSHYGEAQNLVRADQAEAKIVDELVAALKKGAAASIKSQNPPHTLSEWLDIQKRWREAELQLEQVPKDSNIYPLAQQKQQAYRANLAVTNQRLTVEQQAKQFLSAAQEAAKKAETRQGVAQSLESWYLVYSTWQMAVNRLDGIPQGTTAYESAQQLLPDYQSKLTAVRDRTTIEQFAANTYRQSLNIAQQAKHFQTANQWSQAVISWSNALTYLRQIPNGTYYYSKTAETINTYTEALKQAQAQLLTANTLQQARSDLHQTCGTKPQICTFIITRDLIKVRLTSDYMQKVRNAALTAKARNDYNAQAGVVKHVLTLGEALEAISDNAKIRLEVYTPDGNLRQAHNPA